MKVSNMSNQKTHSRGSCVCDHCGKSMNRHNLKKHVQDKHPGKPVRERIVGMLSFDNFVSKVSNSANNNAGHNSQQIEQQIDVLEEEEVEETVTLETIYKQMKQMKILSSV
jgi:hypothetical protein